MAVGMSVAGFANKVLNILCTGTPFPSPPSGLYFKLHVGDPGAAGTANPSAVVTRVLAGYALGSTPGAASMAQTGPTPSWTMTATETITHVSVWDALTGGNFIFSWALAAAQPVVATNVFTTPTYSLAFLSASLAA